MMKHLLIVLVLLSVVTPCRADYSTLDWATVRTLALTHNLQLQMAHEGVTASIHDVQALQSQKKPKITLQSSWSVLRKGTKTSNVHVFEWKTNTDASQSQTTLGLSQLLWDGGKIDAQIQSAQRVFAQANDTLDQDLVTVRYTLRTQFLYLWASQELLKLNQRIVQRRETQFKQLSYKYKAGLENLGALSIAQANLKDAQFHVSDALRHITKNKRELESTVGCALSSEYPSTPQISESIDSSMIDTLALHHPMVQFDAHQIEVIQAERDYQQSLYRPDVVFNIQADKFTSNPFHSHTANTDQWDARIIGTWDIWDSGKRKALVNSYESQLRHSKLAYDDTLKTIKTTLYTAFTDYESAKENLDNQKNSLSAIEERSKIMSKQYESGLVSFNDWSLIEDRRISAEKAVIQAQLDYYIAIDTWILARGGKLNEAL